MLKFLKHHFLWKTVGHREVSYGSENFYVLYWMTESGRRRVRVVVATGSKEVQKKATWRDRAWECGGPFPNTFRENDTLLEMLQRICDRKLTENNGRT